MPQIRNQSIYPLESVPSADDYVIGSDAENNGRTRNYKVSDLAETIQDIIGENIDGIVQDNRFKPLRFTSITPYVKADVATAVNAMSAITVGEKEIFLIIVGQRWIAPVDVNNIPSRHQYVYVLNNLGKGTYGTGGTAITANDLVLIGIASLDPDLILNDAETQEIELGDIGSNDIATGFNAMSPCVTVQDQEDGYVIVTATIDDEDLTYLYIGTGGSYGGGCSQATLADFILLSEYVDNNGITNTSDLINDGENGVDPFITAQTLYVGNAIINNTAGVEYLQDLDFRVWGSSYIINRVTYLNQFLSGNVTLSDAHPTDDRKDTFVLRNYTPSTATLTLTGGGSGSVDEVFADGVDILGSAVSYDTSLAVTATKVVNQINTYCIANNLLYNASNTGAVITIRARHSEDVVDGNTLTCNSTTITTNTSAFSGGSTTKSVGVITGIASGTPYKPVPIADHEVEVTFVDVVAGATDFTFTEVAVWDEGDGDPTEWDVDFFSPNTIDFADASAPTSGTVSIVIPANAESSDIIFSSPTAKPFTSNGTILFDLTIDVVTTNSTIYNFLISNSSTGATNILTLSYLDLINHGFDATDLGNPQTIAINLSEFGTFGDAEFDTIRFSAFNHPELNIDDIRLQYTTEPTVTNIPNLQQVTTAGATTDNPITVYATNSGETVSLFTQTTNAGVLNASAGIGITEDTGVSKGFLRLGNENIHVITLTVDKDQTALAHGLKLPIRGAGSNDVLVAAVNGNLADVNGAITLAPTQTADTSTEINLSNIFGNYCNMASANSTTAYTYTGEVLGGKAKVLINAGSEPSVTSATKIDGAAFVSSTNMYLLVEYNGNRVEYWFETI